MKINAQLQRKDTAVEFTPCEVDKVIDLSASEFSVFSKRLLADYRFIAENADRMGVDTNGVHHCILVLGEGCDDGILVHSSGAGYARYSALIPNARQLVEQEQRPECLNHYLKKLADAYTSAVDYIVREGTEQSEDTTFSIDSDDIPADIDFLEDRYLIDEMLAERPEVLESEYHGYGFEVTFRPEYCQNLQRLPGEVFDESLEDDEEFSEDESLTLTM